MRHFILLEKNFKHSVIAIALLKKAHELYQLMEAGRTAYLLLSDMGREYFAAKDYVTAMRIINSVVGMYRQEEWAALLGSALTYLRECARRLGLAKEFAEYGFELLALPLSVPISHGYVSGSEVDPFGKLERPQLHQELVEFLRGARDIRSQEGEPDISLSSALPVYLEIDLPSPLRTVLSVCVAFHSQSVRLGKVTRLTLAILTHLPLPVIFDEVEVLFNQSSCNFSTLKSNIIEDDQEDEGSDSRSGLELQPRKWKRISIDIIAGIFFIYYYFFGTHTTCTYVDLCYCKVFLLTESQMELVVIDAHSLVLGVFSEESGKLECLAIVAHLGPHATIRCQVESVGTREEIPFWKSEPGIDAPPLADSTLASSGQKVIQVSSKAATLLVQFVA